MPEVAPESTFYVTTPIYYVNDAPHIGHAYTTVAGDVLTRWHRQRGERTFFLTGTDEHGQKVQRTAEANGMTAQAWCDRLVDGEWRPVLETIDAANDDFIRTTEPRHTASVQAMWQAIRDGGDVYTSVYEGPYCVDCEEFKLPGEVVEGTGPFAGQLVCPIHGRPVEQLSEENYFFRLSAYADRLLAHYEENPEAVEPASARNEVMSFIKQGLTDISMSRSSFAWGIPVPWDRSHVVYVWFDALINYATVAGYGTDPERFARMWPADVHLVGKDILRFHAVYWPAMCMAAGIEPPRKVFAHGWLLVGGEKMSKTKLTGIAPSTVVDHFGSDAFRYYFMRAIAFGSDGSFSWEDMTARYTSELANGFGNLASRVAAMVVRYFDAVLPAPRESSPAEDLVRDGAARATATADERMVALDFSGGINAIWELVDVLNGYLTEQEPWQLAKSETDRERLATVMWTAAEGLRVLAVLLNPVMPKACAALWDSLGAQAALGALADQPVAGAARWGQLPQGLTVTKGAVLFPRLPD
jgi:methionyl-tRNA synthetase